MNQNIDIFYNKYLTLDGTRYSIGGIETYIKELAKLARSLDYGVRIFQFSDFNFVKDCKEASIYGVNNSRKNFNSLYKKALSIRNDNEIYINIIANDTLIPKWKVPNSIVIQHGIGFDGIEHSEWPFPLSYIYRTIKAYEVIKKMNNVEEGVCVDNNFICWYRTQTPQRKIKLTPILNFAKVGSERVVKSNKIIKIVFARRFVKIRGTHLFAPVAKQLLSQYNNIEITFAGDGPEKYYLKKIFQYEQRVIFTEYKAEESVDFHEKYNIAVIPTISSEGSSLSLLEAMSAHCATVCTNIGGMTNVILHGFNGLMVSPNKNELYSALSLLIEDDALRQDIAENAYSTIKYSFSIENWQSRWTGVITKKFSEICSR